MGRKYSRMHTPFYLGRYRASLIQSLDRSDKLDLDYERGSCMSRIEIQQFGSMGVTALHFRTKLS